ncbi:hypothetical protein UlMin_036059 [Ulmus minor]
MPRKSQIDDDAEDITIWTPVSTCALLGFLDDYVKKTQGANPIMRDFKVMSENILGTCYKRYVATQIKSKYHRMRVVYAKFKKLINHTSFSWDFDNNTPTCPNDVWSDYCKANPRVKKFKYVGLPDYDMNKNVFEKSNATGGLAYTSANQPCDIDEEEDIEERLLNPDILPSDADEEAFSDYIGGQHSGNKRA